MPFSGLTYRLQQNLPLKSKSLYTLCMMLFFWAMFDGVVSYIVPLTISQGGLSNTMLGLILGSSSIAGAAFDFFLCKFLSNTHFRRVYLLMFILCGVFPFLLAHGSSVWLFLLAMAIWGFYYDLMSFASFDYVGRKADEGHHTSTFGAMNVFKALGYMIAPLIAGLAIGESDTIGWQPFALIGTFLGISFLFYLLMVGVTKKDGPEFMQNVVCRRLNVLVEVHLWRKIGKVLIPILLMTMFFNIFDSFFWTLGPLLTESYKQLHPFNGLFLSAYTFPTLFMGLFVGKLTSRFGKKRTAFVSFL
ncbi:MAG TPA: MFS transporter, partial [Candidatus Saccharimonadia bacterium]|nr:MFS transporter [Candidatus Saccharimonadia bacterium]